MRVHTDGRLVKCVSKNDVGGFASNAGQFEQRVEVVGHFAGMFLDQLPAGGLDRFGFVAVEIDTLEFFLGDVGPIGGGPVFWKNRGGDRVDEVVAGLGGEDEGDEEFERVGKVEREFGVGVRFFERGDDFF
jgi:hypothetical protein